MHTFSLDPYHPQVILGRRVHQDSEKSDKEQMKGGRAKWNPWYGAEAQETLSHSDQHPKVSDKGRPTSQEKGEKPWKVDRRKLPLWVRYYDPKRMDQGQNHRGKGCQRNCRHLEGFLWGERQQTESSSQVTKQKKIARVRMVVVHSHLHHQKCSVQKHNSCSLVPQGLHKNKSRQEFLQDINRRDPE